MTVDQQFTALTEKLQQLLRQQGRMQKEIQHLKNALADSKKTESVSHNKIAELQQQVAILKLAAGEMSEKDKKTFETKLNQYIKEIDRTINYLSP